MSVLKRLLLTVLLVTLGSIYFVSAQADSTTTQDDLLGQWVSIACELRPGPQYLTRDFTFEEDRWFGIFPNYADPVCSEPTLVFKAEGPYALGESLPVAEGAVAGEFVIDTIRLTPQSQAIVDFLNSAPDGDCGVDTWEIGVEQDVSETGCTLLGIDLSEPITEYEVVLVRDGYLFFGARPLDGSGLSSPESRPTALQVPLIPAE